MFHFFDCPRVPGHLKSKLCSSPVLLNKIKLAMIFRVKITKVTAALDMLLQKRLLILEIGLHKKKPPTAAVSSSRRATEICTLCEQAICRPQAAFANDCLHALEPSRHGGVLQREVK